MKQGWLLLIIVSILTSCRCESDLESLDHIPVEDDLIGIWIPDDKTIENSIGFDKNSQSQLVFNSDMSFEIVNFPVSGLVAQANIDGITDRVWGNGSWSVHHDPDEDALNITLNWIHASVEDGFETSWKVMKNDEGYIIWINVGDPDKCHSVRLKRKM